MRGVNLSAQSKASIDLLTDKQTCRLREDKTGLERTGQDRTRQDVQDNDIETLWMINYK